ncbi:MAG: ion transporter [Bacteroidota bacterium]
MKKLINQVFVNDKSVAVVITLNACILFLLSFKELAAYHDLFTKIDAVFLLYFLLEAIFKIADNGWKAYISESWNKFDFIIVIASFPSILLLFENNIPDISFLFILRIIRLFRFFKFLKFIPNIEELIAGIRRAFKASVFVLLAFFIYMFVISMISCRLFGSLEGEAATHFENPLISFYSIFKIFTIEGWYEIPDTISQSFESETAHFFTKLYFVLIVISGGIFGLSIVNAIFVEEMVRDNDDDIRRQISDIEDKLTLLLQKMDSPPPTQLLSDNEENDSLKTS